MLCIVKLAWLSSSTLGFMAFGLVSSGCGRCLVVPWEYPAPLLWCFISFLHHVSLGICNPAEWITSSISSACALLTGILLFHQLNKISLCHCLSPITCLTFCGYYVKVIVTRNLMATTLCMTTDYIQLKGDSSFLLLWQQHLVPVVTMQLAASRFETNRMSTPANKWVHHIWMVAMRRSFCCHSNCLVQCMTHLSLHYCNPYLECNVFACIFNKCSHSPPALFALAFQRMHQYGPAFSKGWYIYAVYCVCCIIT